MSNKLLHAFNRWFASARGVWQTLAVTVTVAAVELSNPTIDPHGFWLLWALTIYSGITQPALAYVSDQASIRLGEVLSRLEHLEEHELEILTQIKENFGGD